MTCLRTPVLLIVLSAVLRSAAPATTLTVDAAGTGQFQDIQAALDAAETGDTIEVLPGTYDIVEPLDFNRLRDPSVDGVPKDLVLRSRDGAAATVIRMQDPPLDPDLGSVLVLRSGETLASAVVGFTLSGGRGSRVSGQLWPFAGGAVLVESGSAVTLGECIIRANATPEGDGGAVACLGSRMRIHNCEISQNECSGVLLRDSQDVFLTGNDIFDNSARGIDARRTSGEIMNTRCGQNGGAGIHAERSALAIVSCELERNRGAGLSLEMDEGSYLQGSKVLWNLMRGIDLSESAPRLWGCFIYANIDEHGGGIHCRDTSSPMVYNCEIAGNRSLDGGGIWAASSAPTLINCLLYANVAQVGPAFHSVGGSTVRLVNCTLYANATRPYEPAAVDPADPADPAGVGDGAQARADGAAAGCEGSAAEIVSCILWADDPEEDCGASSHSLVGVDPRFADPGVIDPDAYDMLDVGGGIQARLPHSVQEVPSLRPASESPARDIGTFEGTIGWDFEWRLRPSGEAPDAGAYEIDSAEAYAFLRGDATSDAAWDLTDAVVVLLHLFVGGDAPPCLKAADTNDDGVVDISDPVQTLNWLFLGGPPPAPPFVACFLDWTVDRLSCDAYEPCL